MWKIISPVLLTLWKSKFETSLSKFCETSLLQYCLHFESPNLRQLCQIFVKCPLLPCRSLRSREWFWNQWSFYLSLEKLQNQNYSCLKYRRRRGETTNFPLSTSVGKFATTTLHCIARVRTTTALLAKGVLEIEWKR